MKSKGENQMKVKSGKLQVGDVKVWKDGSKTVYETQYEVDNEIKWVSKETDSDDVIGYLLSEPSAVKCIKRKKQLKEIELGPDDVMQEGDIIRYSDGDETEVKSNSALEGERIRSLGSYKENNSKVYRPVKSSSKNSWKKTGKMLDKMIEADMSVRLFRGVYDEPCCTAAYTDENGKTQDVFKSSDSIHNAIKFAYDRLVNLGVLE